MHRQLKYVLCLMVLLLIAAPAMAQTSASTAQAVQTGNTIGVGDTVTGTLTTTHPSLTYTLNAQAGQAVNITLTSSDFDAYLILQDGSGNTLAENDDNSGTDSGILGFVLPSASSYQIVAESYGQYEGSGAETGSFTLSVSEQHIDHIEYSQTVNDRLTTDQLTKDYVFSGQEGDVAVITESSSDFDSYLHLLDSTGSELTSNDDSGGTLNSMIGPYTLPSTGSYTIRVDTIDSTSTGSYTLTLSKAEVAAVTFNTPTTVNFTVNDTAKYFSFDGTAGDLVTISADSNGSINTSLTLNDSSNSQIASDDDGGPGLDPEIYQQLLSSTGTYSVVLQAVAPGTGSVTVTIKRTAPPSLDEGTQTMSFSSSQTERAVSFTARANEVVRLTVHSVNGAAGSPSISVLDSDQNTIASASFSYVSDATFTFKPSSAGNVVVQVTDYTGSISYELTLDHPSQQ